MTRALTYFLGVGICLLVLAALAYGTARYGQKDLDQWARAALGGAYLQTDHGMLSYTREGANDAPALILVHGFSTPKFVWDQIKPYLLAAGYQVITYDHFGRGFSDRPSGPYDSDLYQSELAALIKAFELDAPVTLVGYSMGGANVVDYAAAYPQQIKQLVLIAPAGYMPVNDTTTILLMPVLGEWLATVFGKQFAYSSIKTEVDAGRAPASMLEQFNEQAAYKGYTDALLSTLRHFPMSNLAHRYRALGKTDIPVTAIWGTADSIVPYSGAALMQEDLPQLKLQTLQGANHNITFGQPAVVAQALLKALQNP